MRRASQRVWRTNWAERKRDVALSLAKVRHVRRYSYASLLYEEIRCGYSHEYAPGANAYSWLPGQRSGGTAATYVNFGFPDPVRLIHFHIEWIAELPVEIAVSLDKQELALPFGEPAKWWIDG